jgi:hypothetical protein
LLDGMMMVSRDLFNPRRLRRRMLRHAGLGLRDHPLLTAGLIVVAAVALAAAVTAFLVATVLAAIVLAVVVVACIAARELIGLPRARSHRIRSEEPAQILRHYLQAVDEFARLTELAISASIYAPPRGRAFRRASADARCLQRLASDLADDWHGSSHITACLQGLESAADTLVRYLAELRRSGRDRHSPAELHWRRDELSRRRDTLLTYLRETDFSTGGSSDARRSARA